MAGSHDAKAFNKAPGEAPVKLTCRNPPLDAALQAPRKKHQISHLNKLTYV